MVKIQDRLAELSAGIFKIKTKDETEFELVPKIEHKRKLLYNYKQVTENAQMFEKKINSGKVTKEDIDMNKQQSKELLDEQNSIIRAVIKNSYPAFNEEQINNIMVNYDDELLTELYMCFGWIDKEVVEAMKKRRVDELKKLSGEEKPQEKKPQEN